jgi:uncharacterized protein YnzC (UPF0291/DUF896 family)
MSKTFNNNNKKQFKKQFDNKFKTNFKKRVPTWKVIDNEINEILPKYEQVHSLLMSL